MSWKNNYIKGLTTRLNAATDSTRLNHIAEDIVAEMDYDAPEQDTIDAVMTAYKNNQYWDKESNPFDDLTVKHPLLRLEI
jgi:hypothetical protein